MPWDAASLWLADMDAAGGASGARCLCGVDGASSSVQPRWSPEGELYFVSDAGGDYWNLCRAEDLSGDGSYAVVHAAKAEFAGPHWSFGQKWFDFLEGGAILAAYKQGGRSHLATVDPTTGSLSAVDTGGLTELYGLSVYGGKALISAASPSTPPSIVDLDLASGTFTTLLKSSSLDTASLSPYLSTPRSIEFPTAGGATAHAIFYPPTNADYSAPAGTKPPLLVKGHGGPTSATDSALKLGIQYWTSRGWAVADVNYRGSTGYGRTYRNALRGEWGVADCDDMCAVAEYLVAEGEVDANQLAIDGGSAGGYTTLAALTFRDTFSAGASLYGISDLTALAGETHKFESRYLDLLVAPFAGNEDLYKERSPINSLDTLSCPIILFQGLEDKVVPPNQARMFFDAVKDKGLPVSLVEYEGEQHGFRKKKNIIRTLEGEMEFFCRVFGITMAEEPSEAVHIENM